MPYKRQETSLGISINRMLIDILNRFHTKNNVHEEIYVREKHSGS